MATRFDIYTPNQYVGEASPDALRRYVEAELLEISRHMSEQVALELRPIFAAPEKPREGMIVYADGTTWNPGAGKGVYEWDGAAWNKL